MADPVADKFGGARVGIGDGTADVPMLNDPGG